MGDRLTTCFVDAMERVYPDRRPEPDPQAADLTATVGGCAAVIVACCPPEDGRVVLELAPGAVPVRCFRLLDVAVKGNMGWPGQPQATISPTYLKHLERKAPFRVYEVMEPGHDVCAEPGKVLAFLLLFEPPAETVGVHRFRCRVHGAGLDDPLAGELTVTAAEWPADQQLGLVNWAPFNRLIFPYPGVEQDSGRHWQLIEQLLRLLREGGQDTLLLPYFVDYNRPQYPLIQPTWDGDRVTFDFTRFDRVVELALSLGFRRLAGGHLGRKKKLKKFQHDTKNPLLHAVIPYAHAYRQVPFDSRAARNFLSQLLAAVREHLAAKGWAEYYVQHVADEAFGPVAESYVRACTWVRQQWPEIKLFDACSLHSGAQALDMPVPESDYLEPHLDFYRELQAQGKAVWFYTCCYPAVPWLNRFLDFHLNKGGLLPWVVYRHGLSGFLHWGGNQWGTHPQPAERGDSGDGWILFPGPDGPLPSLRWLAQRLGVEDHELLCSLRDHGQAEQADALCARLVTSNTEYRHQTAIVRQVRRELRQAAGAVAPT